MLLVVFVLFFVPFLSPTVSFNNVYGSHFQTVRNFILPASLVNTLETFAAVEKHIFLPWVLPLCMISGNSRRMAIKGI